MKKHILSVIMVVAIVILTSCSKSGDPTPATQAQKTALDSVKAALTGTWDFSSMTVTQISTGKSATTSTCAQSELKAAGVFTNTNWIPLTPEFNYTYNTDGTGSESNLCATATANIIVTAIKNSDDSANITISDAIGKSVLIVYQVRSKNITSTTVTASIVSDGSATPASTGYNVVFKFTRK